MWEPGTHSGPSDPTQQFRIEADAETREPRPTLPLDHNMWYVSKVHYHYILWLRKMLRSGRDVVAYA